MGACRWPARSPTSEQWELRPKIRAQGSDLDKRLAREPYTRPKCRSRKHEAIFGLKAKDDPMVDLLERYPPKPRTKAHPSSSLRNMSVQPLWHVNETVPKLAEISPNPPMPNNFTNTLTNSAQTRHAS